MLGTVPTALGDVAPRSLRARFARVVALLTAVAVAMLGAVVVAPAAQAAGALNFDAAVSAPDEVLQGGTVELSSPRRTRTRPRRTTRPSDWCFLPA